MQDEEEENNIRNQINFAPKIDEKSCNFYLKLLA